MNRVTITVKRPDANLDDFHVETTDGFVKNTSRFRNYFAAMAAATRLQKDLAPARLLDMVGGANASTS